MKPQLRHIINTMNSTKLFTIPVILFMLCSCVNESKQQSVVYEEKRDNVTKISSDMIVSIDDNLPILHTCNIILTGDTLLFDDHLNGDFKFTAYDIHSNNVIGRFGKPGSGPGELANYGGIFYDKTSKNLYVTEAGQGKLYGFYLPEAVPDSSYTPFVKYDMDFNGGNNAYSCPYYINDSTVVCATLVLNKQARSFSSHIGRLNMQTRSVEVIDTLPETDNIRYFISVSPEHNSIFASARTKDEIRMYDLDGHLLKTIYGPDYDERIDNRKFYFANSTFCGDKILAIYAGGSNQKGQDILVLNLDGKYLKTLKFDMPIQTIEYHEKTDRLYIVTDDTPQFGYIRNFSKILDGKEVIDKQPTELAQQKDSIEEKDSIEKIVSISPEDKPDEAPAVDMKSDIVEFIKSSPEAAKQVNGKPSEGPLIFVDANTHGATRTYHLQVGAYPEGEFFRYTIGIMNQSEKPVSIKSFSLPDDYFSAEWSMGNTLQPNMMGFLYLTCKKSLDEKSYPLIIKFCDTKISPQILHMTLFPSGAKLYNKMHGLE